MVGGRHGSVTDSPVIGYGYYTDNKIWCTVQSMTMRNTQMQQQKENNFHSKCNTIRLLSASNKQYDVVKVLLKYHNNSSVEWH
jgi:hypothetical protein